MSDRDFDPMMLIGLHKLAEQNGDGLVPQLLERMTDMAAGRWQQADVVALPELHERPQSRGQALANGSRGGYGRADNVVAFPAPRWQRNAERRGNT